MNGSMEKRNHLVEILTNELPVLRARLGVTQEDVAERIGISRQTYNSIETKKKPMNWTVFVALLTIFRGDAKTCQMLNEMTEFKEDVIKELEI